MRWSVLVLLPLIAGLTYAQELPGVSVIGYGRAAGKPTVVEISATVSGDAELASDASVKVRDARQRLIDTLAALKISSVSVESKGVTISSMVDQNTAALQARNQQLALQGVIIQGNNPIDLGRRVSAVDQLRIVIKEADKLEGPQLMETISKLVDTARNTTVPAMNSYVLQQSAVVPQTPLISFRIPDTSALREAAYKDALEDARKKAASLAGAAGLKLGRIIAVQDVDAFARPAPVVATAAAASVQAPPEMDSGVSTTTLGEIPVNVRLSVQFEVAK